MPVKEDRSVGWTRRSAAISLLLAMDEHRKRAGARVVHLREQRRWNQEDLAHAAGVSVKTISRFENGRHDGRRSTIEKIAKALGVEGAALMGEPPEPLGLGASANGQADEILSLLRSNEARLARIEQFLTARELEDAADEIEDEPPEERAG